jgi:lipid A 3-O-deacylase
MKIPPLLSLALAFSLSLAAPFARADGDRTSGWQPDNLFVQGGVASEARTLVAGATWQSDWERPFAAGRAQIYWEMSFGRWEADRPTGRQSSAWITQIGITPVIRWTPGGGGSHWFAEAGIGANMLLPLYRSRDKRFSTAFNFGDHVAVGRRFGAAGEHELALRLQHFSNAGIKHPNPGENFLQLRYAFRY